eukprot:1190124-Prorocentrum_minimum.AAC.1
MCGPRRSIRHVASSHAPSSPRQHNLVTRGAAISYLPLSKGHYLIEGGGERLKGQAVHTVPCSVVRAGNSYALYSLSTRARLARAPGLFSLDVRDWLAPRVYSLSTAHDCALVNAVGVDSC